MTHVPYSTGHGKKCCIGVSSSLAPDIVFFPCNIFFFELSYNVHMMTETEFSDRETAHRIGEGNREAAAAFVKKHERLVWHIVHRMISLPSEREDACQDIFLKIFRNIAHFRFECRLSTWVGQVAYNHCLNALGKRRLRTTWQASSGDPLEDIPMAGDPGPERITESNDTASRVRALLQRLRPPYSIILTLYHLDGFSYSEIAEMMKMPEGTVKSTLFRARKMLSRQVERTYEREELCSTGT